MTGKYLQNIKTCCKKVVKSNSSDRLPDNFGISVQTGCLLRHVSGSKASHLHKKNIVGPTERSKLRSNFKLGGQDRRFSMKMVICAGALTCVQPG
jgi:hypothetical protein